MPLPIVIAHRGDSSRGLENSMEAIRLALSIPSDMIEVDVRKSRDNRLYIMHDNETGRTAESNIAVEDAESGEIAQVRLKNGEPIPTLAQVLDLISGRAGLNLEIKSKGAGALCAAAVLGAGYRGHVVFSSFNEMEVMDIRRVMPKAPVAEIFDAFNLTDLPAYRSNGYGIISLRKKTVTKALVSACHGHNISVYVWTVNEEDEMKRLISWGVDGIYTNRPALLKQVLSGMAAEQRESRE